MEGSELLLLASWVGKWRFKVRCYALPSSILMAWGLMAPVRDCLSCLTGMRGSWSLLVRPPKGAWASPTTWHTPCRPLLCNIHTHRRGSVSSQFLCITNNHLFKQSFGGQLISLLLLLWSWLAVYAIEGSFFSALKCTR